MSPVVHFCFSDNNQHGESVGERTPKYKDTELIGQCSMVRISPKVTK